MQEYFKLSTFYSQNAAFISFPHLENKKNSLKKGCFYYYKRPAKTNSVNRLEKAAGSFKGSPSAINV